MNFKRLIFTSVLTGQTIYIWRGLYNAQRFEYDDNFGIIIHCFLISLLTLIGLIIIWFVKRQWIKENILITVAWFLTASPITIFMVVTNYEAVFKVKLAH